ncbi:hypothetical protein PVAND_013330 [Polypedilum vanderplanki]|uniref:Uncharacterized protein n=1 Tax=Polypedilum vanderplanki TaxID=319348 RepID=A0A9J6CPD2_POLVA|nr:hypothetical protein PVAND_013330 [Polypedilum vanderplanki]
MNRFDNPFGPPVNCCECIRCKHECTAYCFCRRQARLKQKWPPKPKFRLNWSDKEIPCLICKKANCHHCFLAIPPCDRSDECPSCQFEKDDTAETCK